MIVFLNIFSKVNMKYLDYSLFKECKLLRDHFKSLQAQQSCLIESSCHQWEISTHIYGISILKEEFQAHSASSSVHWYLIPINLVARFETVLPWASEVVYQYGMCWVHICIKHLKSTLIFSWCAILSILVSNYAHNHSYIFYDLFLFFLKPHCWGFTLGSAGTELKTKNIHTRLLNHWK